MLDKPAQTGDKPQMAALAGQPSPVPNRGWQHDEHGHMAAIMRLGFGLARVLLGAVAAAVISFVTFTPYDARLLPTAVNSALPQTQQDQASTLSPDKRAAWHSLRRSRGTLAPASPVSM